MTINNNNPKKYNALVQCYIENKITMQEVADELGKSKSLVSHDFKHNVFPNPIELRNKFEKKVRKFNDRKTILWFADICKQPDGTAKWEAVIFDENGKKVMSETWHDKAKFVWQ
ncbi:hypothetical protein [Enterococcus faecium]|uniref:hypothetical protein n=1 Tax=Enterococcus faecium TaxID=1352 RepID=UPI000A184B6D|nr:hypothetical protein [Enterococcus faecium]SMI65255.1 Uncharacterised protein [Enterococcus faecium]